MSNKKEEKQRKRDELDTETTFADMDVEGMRWHSKKKEKPTKHKLEKGEFWVMVWGAFRAYLPIFFILGVVAGILYCLATLWLG